MQFAAVPPARNHQPSLSHTLFASIALSAALLCLTLPNAYAANHVTVSGNLGAGEVGTRYSATLVASGGTAPYTFALAWGKLPPGLALNEGSGVISGTPSATGTFDFGIHVTDSKKLGGSQNFQVTVSSAIVVTVTPATATVASSGTIQFAAAVANTSNHAVTWAATSGTISAGGLYQASAINANSSATVTATSAADPTKSASASVTITASPLTLSGNFVPAQAGFTYSVPLTVGNGTAPYTFSISSGQLPAGLTLGTNSGTVSGTPSASGTFSFGISATDSKGVTGSATFQVTVSPAVAVTITPATATVISAASAPFTSTVTNSSNLSVTWTATLGTVSSTGLYQAPAVGVNSTATVTATSAADPTKSASATVTVTAIPPTISATFISAQAGFSYSVPLAVSGGTAPFTYAVSSGQLPAGLALSLSSGTVSGIPTTSGTFSFGVTVTDSKSLTGTQTFQVTVSPAVGVSLSPATATVQTPGTVLFTPTVSNSTNLSVTWSTTLGSISPTGLYQSPAVNANSTATVTATSTADPTKSASSTVTVTAIPLTLTANFIAAQVGFTYSVALAVGGGTAPYTYAISSGALPAGITLGASSGAISGNPTAAGTFNFGVTVTDSKSVTGSGTFLVTVSPAVAVTVTPTGGTVQSAGALPLTALVTNTSNTGVTWSAAPGTVSSAGLYQAPTVSANTTATVTAISVADPTKSASASVAVTVIPPSIKTMSLASATAGTAYSNSLSATGGTAPYTWSLASGTLPGGISAQSGGTLSGTTTQAGQFSFSVQVTDSSTPALTSTQPLALTVNSSTGNGGAMPAQLFGFTENGTAASNFPTVSFGLQRFWDSPPLQWPSINTASGVFDFTSLDSVLAQAYTNGVMLSMYTLARTPPWATSAPADASCNYATATSGGGDGECDAPSDLNSDGSGANAIWKAWITNIATHVNDPTYLQTHTHIGYWEIWNEPDTQAFWGGSIAQLARLTEDANCIITGRGVIHENGDGSATPCTATAIDPTAKIVMAAAHAKGVALTYGQNELYCSASPTGYRLPCPNPPNAIATAIDIVNFHMKPGNETGNTCPSPTLCTPESAMQMYISNVKGILQPAELAKPLWNGEGSYSKSGFINAYTDTDMKASFMPRYFLINWSLGVSALHWYTWESMTPTAVQTSYQQAYNWLYGSMLSMPCTAAGTVWSCQITKAGTNYLIMWDTAQSCSNGSCTTGNQTVGSQWTKYQDMTTASTPIEIDGNVVPVGIKPVVLQ
jgi:hypothetical protein